MSLTNLNPCRWLIDIGFVLKTPMHLGNGQDEESQKDDQEVWRAGIMLDYTGKPCIPGASLKGALRALADRQHILDDKLKRLFGHADGDKTIAGLAEFRYAFAQKEIKEESRPHVAIDRVTGTAQDKKLFETRLVPAGTEFKTTIVIHHAGEDDVKALLGLLEQAAADADFSLGAHASQGLGAIEQVTTCARRFGKEEAKKWLADGAKAGSWEGHACKIDLAPNSKPLTRHVPSLPLTLKFSSPFLVKGGVKSRDEHDVTVPMLRGDKVILPASSLRGSLRSQAERILRTLGLPVAQGHEAKPWRKSEAHTDLAAVLFGTAGWRGVVSTSDCVDPKPACDKAVACDKDSTPLVIQEMVAIDRFTGGGKDGAKFSVKVAESPTLKSQLRIDFKRLKAAGEGVCWPALGLFSLLLRDLAEGDIAFGYGISKGYGRCTAQEILENWKTLLIKELGTEPEPLEKALKKLRERKAAQGQPRTGCSDLSNTLPTLNEKNLEEFTPKPNSSGFLNPYHFIPLAKPDVENWTDQAKLKTSRGHDRYNGLSGKITCTLTTKTPVFIGAKRGKESNNQPTSVSGYEYQDKRTIPATSLRGMISSLFESISSSNFRVLHPSCYSMRKSTNIALSAMGRIIQQEDKLYLKPLTLPTLNEPKNKPGSPPQIPYTIPDKWKKVRRFSGKAVFLRVYNDCNWGLQPSAAPCYMKLEQIQLKNGKLPPSPLLRYPKKGTNTQFLIGQRDSNQEPISKETWDAINVIKEKDQYVRGWLRTLKVGGRALPNTVKHLVFLPDPYEDDCLLDLPDEIRDQFHALADMATNSMQKGDRPSDQKLLPFVPAGRESNNDRLKGKPPHLTRLQDGDLVFFDIDNDGKVSEISFSSMWRTGIKKTGKHELATTADLLSQFDPNLLPLGMGQRVPKFSPADLLFGAVEYRPEGGKTDNENQKEQATALAGRVVISMGTSADTVQTDKAVTLKELSSPKPPSPALYFRPLTGEDAYVSKAQLAKNGGHYTLRGRKTYLHALRQDGAVSKLGDQGNVKMDGRLPWESKHHGNEDQGHKRRVMVKPISVGQAFTFNLEFNNLSQAELQQLCATLMPGQAFEHRLGMGKPLGLGSVKIEISSLELVDRQSRYGSDSLSHDRINQALSSDEITSLAALGMLSASKDVQRALLLLGNPDAVGCPVHYPQKRGGRLEDKHFEWFMDNDKSDQNAPNGNRQAMKSLDQNTTQLPTLPRYPVPNQGQQQNLNNNNQRQGQNHRTGGGGQGRR